MRLEEKIPLAPLTTFHIGGPAAFFVRVHDTRELTDALAYASREALPVLVLGGGSNVLIPDEGFQGLVINIASCGVEFQHDHAHTLVRAAAGESWDSMVAQSVSRGLWGIENLSGIPGTVGGAVVQNIGAYGQALSQTLCFAEVFDRHTGTIVRFNNDACAFEYRDSVFKHAGGRYIVLGAVFRLSSTPRPELSYRDMAERFGAQEPSLRALRDAVLDIRKGKFPDLSREGTAGSFFKNPIVPAAQTQTLALRYPGMPLFPLPESSGIKVPLAWFLDRHRGIVDMREARIGGARLYEHQPLVIVATRGTSSRDVVALARLVEEKVRDATHIIIEAEVRIV